MIRLWTLRALVRSNVCEDFIGPHRLKDDHVARLLDLNQADPESYTPATVLSSLQQQLLNAEAQPLTQIADTPLARNIDLLAGQIGLDRTESELLLLVVLQRHHDGLAGVLELAGDLKDRALIKLLADCLGRNGRDVGRALSRGGRLRKTGLLLMDSLDHYSFSNKLDMLAGLADELLDDRASLLDIFRRSLVACGPATLGLDSFPHLAGDIAILRGFLEGASRTRTTGVNILLHGAPGTGKTEFAKTVVAACKFRLLEIPCDDGQGSPRDGNDRLASFNLAQSLLGGNTDTVLLFDEVEDLFASAGADFVQTGNRSGMKAWINQTLECNVVPAFWITNHLESIDPAHRRRFDMVLHMGVPPALVRRAVVDKHAQTLPLPESWRERVARHSTLPPAVVQRATRVGILACGASPYLVADQVVGRVLNHSLSALGHARVIDERTDDSTGDLAYRLDLLNADCDLHQLGDRLARAGGGRFCLYGPPGSGKTAFGHHLARTMQLPLLVRRASDLLAPYVGAAERNIARMFEQARQEGAVLLVDEADSLLRERRHAQRSWEVTQVNEMLTQLEGFNGVFIASTNLMDSLDEAAMRRFDLRVKLGYLGTAQAREMFVALSAQLTLHPEDSALRTVERLLVLTPGDFASVARGARLDPPATAQALACRLEAACQLKADGARRPIGFAA